MFADFLSRSLTGVTMEVFNRRQNKTQHYKITDFFEFEHFWKHLKNPTQKIYNKNISVILSLNYGSKAAQGNQNQNKAEMQFFAGNK